MTIPKKLMYIVLSICTLISKQILIYNEEIIIAFSFIAFLVLCRKYFGTTFQDLLEGRLQAIREELQQFFTPNEALLLKSKEEEADFRTSLQNCRTVIEELPGSYSTPDCERAVRAMLSRTVKNQFSSLQGVLSSGRTRVAEDLMGVFGFSVREGFSTGGTSGALMTQRHPFHLVDPSPWPIAGSLGALATTVGGVMYMHAFQNGEKLLALGIFSLLYTMFVWWRDVTREATLEGHHTKVVQLGLRYGFILFIVSEVLFFFAFFWAFFHSALAPAVELGGIWPPKGIGVLDPWEIPFLNTLILLSSGASVTWAHHALLAGKNKSVVWALVLTVLLAAVFTGFQVLEYYEAPFDLSSSIFGSTFFLATGFHGFHVIIGTLFLLICGLRQYKGHFTSEHHVGFEAAAWYWHFVDVVWLFLFVSIYWWGGV